MEQMGPPVVLPCFALALTSRTRTRVPRYSIPSNLVTGGCWRRKEGHHHLRTVPSAEVLPQDPDAFGARTGEEV